MLLKRGAIVGSISVAKIKKKDSMQRLSACSRLLVRYGTIDLSLTLRQGELGLKPLSTLATAQCKIQNKLFDHSGNTNLNGQIFMQPRRYAGHSKWQNIKHTKAAKDKQKHQVTETVLRNVRNAVRGKYFPYGCWHVHCIGE